MKIEFCPVAIDTDRYYREKDREWLEEQEMREQAISEMPKTRAHLLRNWNFLSETIGEESSNDEIPAAFSAGDTELGAAVRKLVEGRLDVLLEDVVEGISYGGVMKKLRERYE